MLQYSIFSSVQFISFAQLCLTLCNPMDCSTPGFPVHHQFYWIQFYQTFCQYLKFKFLLVQFSCSVVSDPLWHHGLQHTRLPCPSPTPRVYLNSCPLSQWCHPTISSSVIPFSFPTLNFSQHQGLSDESFLHTRWPKYWSFSFSISPFNEIQDWFPLGRTGWISLQSKGLSRVFSNTTVQKHQFLDTQLSL